MMNPSKDVTQSNNESMEGMMDPFARDITGLSEATATQVVALLPDVVFELRAEQVRKRIGDTTVKMLAYNTSLPCATLKVAQGSEVTVHFTNDMDLESTVHWHGLRLDNRFDGIPRGAPGDDGIGS